MLTAMLTAEDRFTLFLRAVAGLVFVGFAIAYAARRDAPPAALFGTLGLLWWWGAYRLYRQRSRPKQ